MTAAPETRDRTAKDIFLDALAVAAPRERPVFVVGLAEARRGPPLGVRTGSPGYPLVGVDARPPPDAPRRLWLRSVHDHDVHPPERPFKSVTVLYAPDTGFPVSIHSYDWPDALRDIPCQLAERHEHHGLQLDAPLNALDFDLGNPDHGFRR